MIDRIHFGQSGPSHRGGVKQTPDGNVSRRIDLQARSTIYLIELMRSLWRKMPDQAKARLSFARSIARRLLGMPLETAPRTRSSVDWASAADGYLGYFDSDADRLRRELLDPLILDLLRPAGKRIVDLGCGEGYFSRILRGRQAQRVLGLDVAAELIGEAIAKDPGGEYLAFDVGRDDLSEPERFDSVVAHMFLMDVDDLGLVFRKIHGWLRPEGQFVASITSPYYGYPVGIWRSVPESVADRLGRTLLITTYFDERSVEKKLGAMRVPHTHRPFGTYLNLAYENGLVLRGLHEPRISVQLSRRYPNLRLAHQLAHVPLFFVMDFRRAK